MCKKYSTPKIQLHNYKEKRSCKVSIFVSLDMTKCRQTCNFHLYQYYNARKINLAAYWELLVSPSTVCVRLAYILHW